MIDVKLHDGNLDSALWDKFGDRWRIEAATKLLPPLTKSVVWCQPRPGDWPPLVCRSRRAADRSSHGSGEAVPHRSSLLNGATCELTHSKDASANNTFGALGPKDC